MCSTARSTVCTYHHYASFRLHRGPTDETLDETLPSLRKILGLHRPTHTSESQPEPQHIGDNLPLDDSSAEPPVLAEHASSRATDAEESDGEEEDNRLKLGRFAYAAPHVPRRTASKTPSPSDADTGLPEAPVERRRTERAATHRFTTDFSDKELSRILKCIACDLAWTARKSVKQKMKHIQSCAKKRGLTDETVAHLIRAEIQLAASEAPAEEASGKGKGKAAPKEKEKKQKHEIAVTKKLEEWYVGDVREAVRYWNSLNNTQRGREWQRVQGRPPPGAQRYAVFEGEDMVRSDRFLHSCDRADVPISASSVASSRTPSIAFGAPGPACPRAGDASTRRKSAWASEARSPHTE